MPDSVLEPVMLEVLESHPGGILWLAARAEQFPTDVTMPAFRIYAGSEAPTWRALKPGEIIRIAATVERPTT